MGLVGLDRVGLSLVGLDWVRLGFVGLGWVGLVELVKLGLFVLVCIEQVGLG